MNRLEKYNKTYHKKHIITVNQKVFVIIYICTCLQKLNTLYTQGLKKKLYKIYYIYQTNKKNEMKCVI